MGLDFIYKVGRSFKRGWDGRKREFSERTLFSPRVKERPRSIQMAPLNGDGFKGGEEVLLRSTDSAITAYSRDNEPIGECKSPPADVKGKMLRSDGVAWGKVAKVHELSRSAEVEVY